MMKYNLYFLLALIILTVSGCEQVTETPPVMPDFSRLPYEKLSDYHFFTGKLSDFIPNKRVIPYDLNSALFTDYAHKTRFVWMPEGAYAEYKEVGALAFPDKTILIKQFYYPKDFSKPKEALQMIETRLLIKNEGLWQAYTYIWNESGTEAVLDIVGDTRTVSWKDEQGKSQTAHYQIPNKNQCKSCHNFQETLQPVGPKAKNLNKDFHYSKDETINQLKKWENLGILNGLSPQTPYMPVWNQEKTGTLSQRAMAYLDINCGHCHNPEGPGGSSGLTLTYEETNLHKIGLCKSPVASGNGSAGLFYDIHPGHPDSSILVTRMLSNNPGEMMPEVGRTIVHTEGVALIRQWIASIEGKCEGKK